MSGYTDIIRRWAMDNRYTGALADADGTGEVGLESEVVGSRLAVRFTIRTDLERVADIRYQVFGCGFSMATCAVAAELAVGAPLDEVLRIDAGRLDKALKGLPKERSYCADLTVTALHAAVQSAGSDHQPVQGSLQPAASHDQAATANDPLYIALMNTSTPAHITAEDRHLFACLLSIAARSPVLITEALGLPEGEIDGLLQRFFPGFDRFALDDYSLPATAEPPVQNRELLAILRSHLPQEEAETALWLVPALCARAAQPGHLWSAMGLFARSELSAAIRRHLPSLAAANSQNMRWKRYLFKQLCELNGGVMCKAPNCGVCSDYAFCFAED